jgi:hypothetical protein
MPDDRAGCRVGAETNCSGNHNSSRTCVNCPSSTSSTAHHRLQTLRLPLARLSELGVDPRDLRSVALVFDRRPSGVLYVGDLQVCN